MLFLFLSAIAQIRIALGGWWWSSKETKSHAARKRKLQTDPNQPIIFIHPLALSNHSTIFREYQTIFSHSNHVYFTHYLVSSKTIFTIELKGQNTLLFF